MRACTLLVTIAAVLAPTTARGDDKAEAIALFDQAVKDMQGGKTEQACRLLAASLAKYADSGTKGALAECYTELGRVASAWKLWRELADTAPAADLRADAAINAVTLEPRLPRFTIKLGTPLAAGLVVSINAAPADSTIGIPLPVDPGQLTVTAVAPGYREWSRTFQAVEGKVTTIEVPPLVELPKSLMPAPAPVAEPVAATETVVLREDRSGTRRSRHITGLSLGLVGVAAVGAGVYFGNVASGHWDDANATCGGMVDRCPTSAVPAAQASVESARSNATVSTVFVSAGGAAVVLGAIVWLSAPSAEPNARRVRVSGSMDARSFGLVVSGAL